MATLDEWAERVRQQEESGLSQLEFCAREGLNPNTFKDRKYRLGKANRVEGKRKRKASRRRSDRSRKKTAKVSFVELGLERLGAGPETIEVLVAGATIRVRSGFDAQALGQVIAVLERRT